MTRCTRAAYAASSVRMMRRALGWKYGALVHSIRGLSLGARGFGLSRTDAALAAALLVVAALEAVLSVRPAQVAAFLAIPALTVPLAYRQRAPVAVALMVTAALVVPAIVGSTVLLGRRPSV